MASPGRRRPAAIWLLLSLLAFLAFGGLYGGLAMLADPSGQAKACSTATRSAASIAPRRRP